MPIGKDNTAAAREPRAVGLRFDRSRVVVELSDGREVGVPLERYPTLLRAKPAARARWTLIGPGKSFHWPALDLDLSVRGLVSGLPEVIPAPPGTSVQGKSATARARGAA